MKRRQFIRLMAAGSLTPWVSASQAATPQQDDLVYHHDVSVPPEALTRLSASAEQWRETLSDDAWQVLFRHRTEPPFSSPLDSLYEDGTYVCAACHLPLFSSESKYDSRTGWPSFWQPIEDHMGTRWDFQLLWPRREYHCVRCGGHQGHVFNDGPEPTGQRWCNNGLALTFVAADRPLPDLRHPHATP